MNYNRKSALGRGLDALIQLDEPLEAKGSSNISEIEISKISANPDQPRREFDDDALLELSQSIAALGIIQPVTLRDMGNGKYQIIAGERRYRASMLAGKETIPAYVRTATDENVLEMALIENIQREDLNPIEVALTYQKLMEQYSMTQETLSERVGKNRATISNLVRMLKLPAEIQLGLKNKLISAGHAKALLSLNNPEDQLCVYEETVKNEFSVRKVEEIVKAINDGELSPVNTQKEAKPRLPEEYGILKEHLSKFFKSKVQLSYNDKGKGKISIPFKSGEELERIIGDRKSVVKGKRGRTGVVRGWRRVRQ